MNQTDPINQPNKPVSTYSHKRLRTGMIITFFGYLALILGAKPSIFGLDRSPVIGFVQTAMIIVGIGIICIGGYTCLKSFWLRKQVSLTADFGLRIVATGFVICVFTGMADVFGFGSHPFPGVPFFGPLQAIGVIAGEAVIAIGMVMMFSPPSDETPKKQTNR